ncbi:redoxin domain-containing protein [Desulfococcaceae bacterium HSG8]|nr:redoxin domain-containing protein [Desulfococcaceae bacterium HSG8]
MKNVFRCLVILICLIVSAGLVFATDTQPPAQDGMLPEITLPVPKNSAHQDYLWVTGKTSFTIPQVKAEVVIIEIFSMYCPHCQREAPAVNKLYKKIENNRKLKGRVKLIGIGAGNSDFEVSFFKKKYRIPFPLFSDADFSIHEKLGSVRTPYFIAVRINKDGTHRVFYSKLGAIKDTDQFLNMISGEVKRDE